MLKNKKIAISVIVIVFTMFVVVGCLRKDETKLSTGNMGTKETELKNAKMDVENIIRETDFKVKRTKSKKDFDFNRDYYDEDIPVFRHFENVIDHEQFTQYYLYYNEQGKLIYAEIAHYRGALYSIYYHEDELLHVEVGSFSKDSDVSVNGDMADVEAVIKKDSHYAFILEDNSLCLEYAYS